MHKVGPTSTGMVIVEMTKEQFDALSKISSPSKLHSHHDSDEAESMSFEEKLEFVNPRIIKLGPKKTDSLKQGIKTMFNFKGGIGDEEVDKIVDRLKRDKIISISPTDKVTYS